MLVGKAAIILLLYDSEVTVSGCKKDKSIELPWSRWPRSRFCKHLKEVLHFDPISNPAEAIKTIQVFKAKHVWQCCRPEASIAKLPQNL